MRKYLYLFLVFQTTVPLMAQIMPVEVSPIFMLETSMATIVVSVLMGFSGIDCMV